MWCAGNRRALRVFPSGLSHQQLRPPPAPAAMRRSRSVLRSSSRCLQDALRRRPTGIAFLEFFACARCRTPMPKFDSEGIRARWISGPRGRCKHAPPARNKVHRRSTPSTTLTACCASLSLPLPQRGCPASSRLGDVRRLPCSNIQCLVYVAACPHALTLAMTKPPYYRFWNILWMFLCRLLHPGFM